MSTTPRQYLRALAWDALEQLRLGKLRPTRGYYIEDPEFEDSPNDDDTGFDNDTTIGQLRNTVCMTCAAGSLMLAHLLQRPDDTPMGNNTNLHKELCELVGREQFGLIEGCFEGFSAWGDVARDYKASYPDEEDRLRAILENIVRNDGEFLPEEDLRVEAAA